MKALYIHTSFAGQHHHVIRFLAEQPGNQVICLKHKYASPSLGGSGKAIPNVRVVEFAPAKPNTVPAANSLTTKYEMDIENGKAVFYTCLELKKQGFIPDIIVCHSANGLGLFVKSVYPDTPLLFYAENYVTPALFPAENPASHPHIFRSRTFNAAALSVLVSCDAAIAPLEYQKNTFPIDFHSKFSVIFDGIDTDLLKPRAIPQIQLAPGVILTPEHEVVTYNARGFEKARGFDMFMQAAGRILNERPNCYIIAIGGKGECYSGSLDVASLTRQYITDNDRSRLCFTGELPYEHYIGVLQRSDVHIYLTHPFVLSWSFMEALSIGCCVVSSNNPPVTEVIRHGHNGILAELSAPDDIAAHVIRLLGEKEERMEIGKNARQTIIENYSVEAVLPQHLALLQKLTGTGITHPISMQASFR